MGVTMTKSSKPIRVRRDEEQAAEPARSDLPLAKPQTMRADPPTHEDDPILTPSEVGRQLGKTGQTITNWIKDGLLTAIRQPSGLWGVRKSEVNKFLGGSALDKQVT